MPESHIEIMQELRAAKAHVDHFMSEKWPTRDFELSEINETINVCDFIKMEGSHVDYMDYEMIQNRLRRFAMGA